MRRLVFLALTACGRIGFDPLGPGGDGGVSGDSQVLPACSAAVQTTPDVFFAGSGPTQTSPSLAWLGVGQGYALGWANDTAGTLESWYVHIFESGVGSPRQLTTGGGVGPEVAWTGSVVAFTMRPSAASGDVFLRRLDIDGSLIGSVLMVTSQEALFDAPEVAARAGEIGVGWLEDPMSRPAFAVYRSDGSVVVPPAPIAATTSQQGVNVAGSATSWLVTYGGSVGRPQTDLLYVILGLDGVLMGSARSATGASATTTGQVLQPSIAARPGGYALAWVDTRDGDDAIYTALLADDGSVVRPPARVANTGASRAPAVAWGPLGTALVWYEGLTAADVRATWIDAPDVPSIVLSSQSTSPLTLDVAVGADEAKVMWSDDRTGNSPDLRGARFGCP